MLKQKYFLADIFILSAEKQPIKLSWRKIVWLQNVFIFFICLACYSHYYEYILLSAHEKSIDLFTYNIGIMSYIDNEILERLIGTMVEGFTRIEKKLDQMNRLKECMNGDRLLDNVDLAELLGVSQRTLARYRQEGKIKYYSVEKNGKSFYLASEIQSFLLQRGKNIVNNK